MASLKWDEFKGKYCSKFLPIVGFWGISLMLTEKCNLSFTSFHSFPSFPSGGDIWLCITISFNRRSLSVGTTEDSASVELTTEGSAECCTEGTFGRSLVITEELKKMEWTDFRECQEIPYWVWKSFYHGCSILLGTQYIPEKLDEIDPSIF